MNPRCPVSGNLQVAGRSAWRSATSRPRWARAAPQSSLKADDEGWGGNTSVRQGQPGYLRHDAPAAPFRPGRSAWFGHNAEHVDPVPQRRGSSVSTSFGEKGFPADATFRVRMAGRQLDTRLRGAPSSALAEEVASSVVAGRRVAIKTRRAQPGSGPGHHQLLRR